MSTKTTLKVEPRPLYIQLNALESFTGSAYMEYGNTKVLAFVEPPRVMRTNVATPCQINCTLRYVPNVTEDSTSIVAKTLKNVLESAVCRKKFSNMQLDVRITVLEDDGCVLSTAINCCGAALVVAGIPTFDLIAASTIGYYNDMEHVNPDEPTEQLFEPTNRLNLTNRNYGIVTVASFTSFNQIIGCSQKGFLSKWAFELMLGHALDLNNKLSSSVKHVLLQKVKKTIADDNTNQNEAIEDENE